MRRLSAILASCAVAFSVAHEARAASNQENVALVAGPPISDIISPYDPALACLKSSLTSEQRKVVFSVGSFVDKTGKTNYVSDSGTGAFSTQGLEDMLYTSLAFTGVQVADTSGLYRSMIDWITNKVSGPNSPYVMRLLFPEVLISGAITSFDINMSSGGGSIRVAGVGGSRQSRRILIGMEGRAVMMPDGNRNSALPRAGTVVAQTRFQKQIVGYVTEAGATSFFGNGGATLFEIDLGTRQNEAIQHMERVMMDRLAFMLVSDYFDIAQCDTHREYGDSLALPQ